MDSTMDSTVGSPTDLIDAPTANTYSSTEMSFLGSRHIRILAGEGSNTKEFSVHETLICSRSRVIQKALNLGTTDLGEKTIALSHAEPSVFLSYLGVLYAGDSFVEETHRQQRRQVPQPPPPAEWVLSMCKVYVLAAKLLDHTTQLFVEMRLLSLSKDFRSAEKCPSLEAVRVIYNGTPRGDNMRMFLYMTYADSGSLSIFASDLKDGSTVPPDFLQDMARALLNARPTAETFRKLSEDSENWRRMWNELVDDYQELSKKYGETHAKLSKTTDAYRAVRRWRNADKAEVESKLQDIAVKDLTIQDKDRVIEEQLEVIQGKDRIIRDTQEELERISVQNDALKLAMERLYQEKFGKDSSGGDSDSGSRSDVHSEPHSDSRSEPHSSSSDSTTEDEDLDAPKRSSLSFLKYSA
ncbi:hypothetical protein E8E13_004175 [Curvularia kusanoi]|uniref:BTB domain-containing protein n=1 Tax=Curvularia kusanoi TaxID=90978 RepID=A0A9P4TE78_CURKU|nr:hypothetical protein E8E13_004175 [Curvularia kusanoi]